MIGAQVKNIRRTGGPASKRGKPNPEYGPTVQRLAIAQGNVSIGDDKQGTRIYHFHDTPLDRLYSRLVRRAGSYQEQQIRREYIALQKYKNHWFAAGLECALGSADLNRVFASDPGSMSGMAKTERQAHHRQEYRAARKEIGHKPGIVLDNIVCAELSLEMAGASIGYGSYYKAGRKSYASPYRAREEATKLLREAGAKLAQFWGIS